MNKLAEFSKIFVLTIFSLSSPAWCGSFPVLHLENAFPKLKFSMPVWITAPPDQSRRLFLVQQMGKVLVFKNKSSAQRASVFLDLSGKVRHVHAEDGLLCMAFHPRFAQNGLFYVYYVADNPHREVLSEFKVSSRNPNLADPSSERILLEIPKSFGNHNGATLLFGPEGYLYFGLGDGGGAGDPYDTAQNLKKFWGKILRIDVDHRDPGLAYSIPKTNPFAGHPGVRGEIWAYGVRNPWRMSFDRLTGDLWLGDVGQNKWEEIDIVKKGLDYGWPLLEGTHPYRTIIPKGPLESPILDYSHTQGACITGGYVYRGNKLKGFEGAYFYADYILGWIRALRYENGKVTLDEKVVDQPNNISSFGEDENGELYLLGYNNGVVYKLAE